MMNRDKKQRTFALVAVASALLLAACATPTPAAPTVAAPPAESMVAATVEAQEEAPVTTEAATAASLPAKLDVNRATGDEFLATIPDLGNRMVREFQEYRPYISIQQFRKEIGKYVDDAQVAAYEEYLFVPVDVNESDAATLAQLPGVDEPLAQELMAARPYADNGAFLAALATHVTPDEAAAATAYLVSK